MGGKGSDGEGAAKKHAPLHERDQASPEPERLVRPAEEAGMAPHQREDPPQAEGDREEGGDDQSGRNGSG